MSGELKFVVALLAFLSMIGAAILGLFIKKRRPAEHLQDNTSTVVELLAGLFVVMTSLVLGFMINSAKDTFAANDRTFILWRLTSSCWIEPYRDWDRRPRTLVVIWLNTSRSG